MGNASRTPASDKAPEDFLPPPMPEVRKKVLSLIVTRASGEAETTVLILRPGDVATLDGQTIAEG